MQTFYDSALLQLQYNQSSSFWSLSVFTEIGFFFFIISAALMARSLLNKNIFNVGETLKLKGNITVNTQKIVIAESK